MQNAECRIQNVKAPQPSGSVYVISHAILLSPVSCPLYSWDRGAQ